jgi:hypothetical protein
VGNFYTNVLVRGVERARLVEDLRGLRRDAYVLAVESDFSLVCDRESDTQREGVIDSLALTIARRQACHAIGALNHDDDCLVLWLFDPAGELCQYGWQRGGAGFDIPGGSRKEFAARARVGFGTSPRARQPLAVLSQGPLWRQLAVRAVSWWGERLLAIAEHERVLAEVGLPAIAAGAGYTYVARGELSGVPGVAIERV